MVNELAFFLESAVFFQWLFFWVRVERSSCSALKKSTNAQDMLAQAAHFPISRLLVSK